MPTTITVDERLIEEARKIGKQRTKKGTVIEALQEYIQRRKQLELINIFGTIEYDRDYDYKKQRKLA